MERLDHFEVKRDFLRKQTHRSEEELSAWPYFKVQNLFDFQSEEIFFLFVSVWQFSNFGFFQLNSGGFKTKIP